MRWVVGIFTCWLIVGFAFGALAQEGIEPQVLSVYYTEEPPVIDGDLAEWEHLTPIYLSSAAPPWLQGFRVWEPLVTREPVIAPTFSSAQIWLLWDQHNLYLAARIWEEDVSKYSRLNLYIDPQGRRSNKVLPDQVCFRVANQTSLRDGAVQEDLQSRRTSPLWEVVTAPWSGGWTLEAVLPLNGVLGSVLRANMEMTCEITLEKMDQDGKRLSSLAYFGGMEHWIKSYSWGTLLLKK